MRKLVTKSNLARRDDLYDLLVGLHDGLPDTESRKINAKLILLLANHIGDPDIVREAIEIAQTGHHDKQ